MSGADQARDAHWRRARLVSVGGWIVLTGMLLVTAAGAGLLLRGVALRQLRGLGPVAGDPLLFVLAAAAAIGAVLLAVGLVLYVGIPGLDPVLARRDWDHPRTIVACLLVVFLIGNLLPLPALLATDWWAATQRAAAEGGAAPPLSVPTLVVAMLATQLGLVGVLVWRVVRPGALSWEDMGLTTVGLGRRLQQGAVGGLAIFFLAGLVGALMRQLGIEQTQARMFEGIRGVGPAQFLSFWLAAAVVAPICEEVFFRGYVFGALRGRYGRSIAYLGSAVLFAAIHFNLPALIPILLMALGLAFLYDRSGSVVPGIVAHGLNNATALILIYSGVGAT